MFGSKRREYERWENQREAELDAMHKKCVYWRTPESKKRILNVLDGHDNPWSIDYHFRATLSRPLYEINVYNFAHAEWRFLYSSSYAIIGVKQGEFFRLAQEHFNAVTTDLGSYLVWPSIQDAERMIRELVPYYESYHIPLAVEYRKKQYSSSGYVPAFSEFDQVVGLPYAYRKPATVEGEGEIKKRQM